MVKLIDGGELAALQEENNRLFIENKTLAGKLQACEKDAARYRWLRDPANAEVAETLFLDFNEDGSTETYYQASGESLDGEIDARIAEAPKP
jgi:hypothetical protein